mmetsp:Transcript_22061/g.33691  ORF Transcript_22061/g.33691 Transcript_22061/m.33691 type:complete len:403 (+) Transcript_22061:141-1349(+)|eukprot:CAMPEP_0196807666 /NCGR_PEP_ID=MMETSP1362-20130617/7665_1 /TAXON_ID=163516 /ORGANISM="Leptocylindrus danicus, Strain CCMP1856" /LENGTH=402 /DNA_ID=CAMNT_0042181683 /DNA_START=44 /DNA_END=1252 /DNA_ORIENTATION=+
MTISLNNEGEPKSDVMTESKFLASRAKRAEALQAKKLQRRNHLDQQSDPDESMTQFMSNFLVNASSIRQDLDDIKSNGVAITSAKRHQAEERLDAIHALVRDLQLGASKSLSIKTTADERKLQDSMQLLFQEVEDARKVVIPRKKFAFKNKRDNPSTKASAAIDGPKAVDESHEKPLGSAVDTTKVESADKRHDYFQREFADKSNCHIVYDALDTNDTTSDGDDSGCNNNHFRLRRINNCVVVLKQSFGALRIQDINDCTIYCGPVEGSVYVENCKNCTIFLAAQQLRIHDTSGVDFYVHLVSGPIIENCSGVRFGEYKLLSYSGLDEQMKKCGLSETTNCYADVKDFKWHKARKSPNWNIIGEEEAIPEAKSDLVNIGIFSSETDQEAHADHEEESSDDEL